MRWLAASRLQNFARYEKLLVAVHHSTMATSFAAHLREAPRETCQEKPGLWCENLKEHQTHPLFFAKNIYIIPKRYKPMDHAIHSLRSSRNTARA